MYTHLCGPVPRFGGTLFLTRDPKSGWVGGCIFGWVWVYAPTWPGISLWRYPFLDPRAEEGGWVDGVAKPSHLSSSSFSSGHFDFASFSISPDFLMSAFSYPLLSIADFWIASSAFFLFSIPISFTDFPRPSVPFSPRSPFLLFSSNLRVSLPILSPVSDIF